jgi:hypothetical protein
MDKKDTSPPSRLHKIDHDRLSSLVSSEARISHIEERIQPNPELIAGGWKRRFFTDSHRAAEMVKTYEELGFEVYLEPVAATEFSDDCEDCQLLALLKFVTIYTRMPKKDKKSSRD